MLYQRYGRGSFLLPKVLSNPKEASDSCSTTIPFIRTDTQDERSIDPTEELEETLDLDSSFLCLLCASLNMDLVYIHVDAGLDSV